MRRDNPGVYIPPPLFYVIIFLSAGFMQKRVHLGNSFFKSPVSGAIGVILILASLFFLIRSLLQFLSSRNTLITIKAASSLQTKGIYSYTRNPMYVGLALVYLGLTCFIGNWWNVILLPLLLFLIQWFVIRKEEAYLEREFGADYNEYKKRVRRWI
jgi:protein-S-isoprenylcysteine O-methyltransferase Ste14